MNKLSTVLFILFTILVCAIYIDMNNKYKDLYIQLQIETAVRKQNESAIDKDLRLLKTDTAILMYGYEENYDR